eukprot:scaffold21_cov368-Prasinococcus_capsulatus_cf.AAC.18
MTIVYMNLGRSGKDFRGWPGLSTTGMRRPRDASGIRGGASDPRCPRLSTPYLVVMSQLSSPWEVSSRQNYVQYMD